MGFSREPTDTLSRLAKHGIRRSLQALRLDAFEEWLVNRGARDAAEHYETPAVGPAPECEHWLFGQPSPGPVLECPRQPGEDDRMQLLQVVYLASQLRAVNVRY